MGDARDGECGQGGDTGWHQRRGVDRQLHRHGAYSLWRARDCSRTRTWAGLSNGGKLPVMLPMTCQEGYYSIRTLRAAYDAVAEVVTRAAGKGAVASWSATGGSVAAGTTTWTAAFSSRCLPIRTAGSLGAGDDCRQAQPVGQRLLL